MRKGNLIAKEFANNKVDVIIYAVERSLDSYKFNLLHNKQLFINQLKTNTLGSRTIDEGSMDEDSGMNFSEYVAVLSGNTDHNGETIDFANFVVLPFGTSFLVNLL